MPETLFNQLQIQVEEYDDWRDLIDRLQTYASTKVSLQLTDRPVNVGQKNGPTAMDISSYGQKPNVTC